MTRGKHGAESTRRQLDEALATIDWMRHEYDALTEVRHREKIEANRAERERQSELLAAKRDAAHHATENLRADLAAARDEIELRKKGLKQAGDALIRLGNKLQDALIANGMTDVESFEATLRIARHMVVKDQVIMVGDLVATHGSHAAVNLARSPDEVVTVGSPAEQKVKHYQKLKGIRHWDEVEV